MIRRITFYMTAAILVSVVLAFIGNYSESRRVAHELSSKGATIGWYGWEPVIVECHGKIDVHFVTLIHELPAIRHVDLSKSDVTDDICFMLSNGRKFVSIDLDGTNVSEKGVRAFIHHAPSVVVKAPSHLGLCGEIGKHGKVTCNE